MSRSKAKSPAPRPPAPAPPARKSVSVVPVAILLLASITALGWFLLRRGAVEALGHIEKGAELAQQDRMREAVLEWETASKLDPANPTVWELLGDSYIREGRWKDGAAAFRKLVNVRPDTAEAKSRLAACLVRAGLMDEAWNYASEELKRNPDSIPALIVLGKLGKPKEQDAEGILALRRLIHLKPDNPEYLLLLSTALADRDELAEAQAILDKVITLDPKNAEARARRGAALMRSGASRDRLTRAEADFRASLAVIPDRPFTLYHLGNLLLATGRASEAVKHLEMASRLAPKRAGTWYLLSQAARRSGSAARADKALAEYRKVQAGQARLSKLEMMIMQDPNSLGRLVELGTAYLEWGDLPKARYYLIRAQRVQPNDPQVTSLLSRLGDPGFDPNSETEWRNAP